MIFKVSSLIKNISASSTFGHLIFLSYLFNISFSFVHFQQIKTMTFFFIDAFVLIMFRSNGHVCSFILFIIFFLFKVTTLLIYFYFLLVKWALHLTWGLNDPEMRRCIIFNWKWGSQVPHCLWFFILHLSPLTIWSSF